MDVEQLYAEAEACYEGFEQCYGIYMQLELDMLYVYHFIEQHLAAGLDPEDILETTKNMIISAADAAAAAQDGIHD